MAGDDAVPAAVAEDLAAAAEASPSPPKRRGFFSRIWRGIFGRGREDYEKRLQYLSKEEAAVHSRMKRRAQTSRRAVRNLIVFSVISWGVAVAYAIMTTRSQDLDWQMRAIRCLPMFLLPGLSFVIYSTLVRFTRMLDRKDQKTLERLRAERKAKIDELKERTNYYATQQLIQKYDLDPAAKAAAATILASKLGADSGLKVFVGDESKTSAPFAQSNDVDPTQTTGLRNRKQPHASSNSTGSTVISQPLSEISSELGADGQEIGAQSQRVVEHYKGSGGNDGSWIARLAALLVGEDPSQSYALICGNCHMHNGLARKEDFPHISYYCPHCHALNTSQQSAELDSSSGRGISLTPVEGKSEGNVAKDEVNLAEAPEVPIGQNDEKQNTSKAS
ncbi:hypothetical protein Cni_G19487 [Canna indica]|uniref:Lunapark zinc ribbon domain-containing protein n=1 Tax=Canna indica TaxID=4628 RepID=A0AAQ3KKL4_9LILI|nr:hypothetical protein Cni_G19487 [Canna indica]